MYTATIPFLDLDKMYHSGSVFSWSKINDNTYSIIHKDNYVEVTQLSRDKFQFSCSEKIFNTIWYDYFDLDTDYESLWIRALVRGNEYQHNAVRYGYGIRILRQDPWEMMLTFMISQNNNMQRIRQSLDVMREKYGRGVFYNDDNCQTHFYKILPDARTLALSYQVDQYKDCGLGYRDVYIKELAEFFYENGDDIISRYMEMDTDKLLQSLMQHKGIGKKVSSEIALCGFHRITEIPIDTHIKQIVKEHFNNDITFFNQFDGYQGLLAQWLFDYETNCSH